MYLSNVTYALKQFTKNLMAAVGYRAEVSVEGSDYADLTLAEKDGRVMANIINRAGEHNATGVRTFREIPPIGPLTLRVRTATEPKRVTLRPENLTLTATKDEDGYTYQIPRLDIHTIAEIEL